MGLAMKYILPALLLALSIGACSTLDPQAVLQISKSSWRVETQCSLPILDKVALRQTVLTNPAEEIAHADLATLEIVFDHRFFWLTTDERLSLFKHELGHILGLWHRWYPSIMSSPLDAHSRILPNDAEDVRQIQKCG